MFISGWRCVVSDVLEDPGRSLRFGQCGHGAQSGYVVRCQPPAVCHQFDPQAQVFVELIHDCNRGSPTEMSPRPGLRWRSTIDVRFRTVVGDHVDRPRANH